VTELNVPCGICKAKKGEPCRNTIQAGEPLPGRDFHDGRIERFYCQGCGRPHSTVDSCGRKK
jgi:hypothetical protein